MERFLTRALMSHQFSTLQGVQVVCVFIFYKSPDSPPYNSRLRTKALARLLRLGVVSSPRLVLGHCWQQRALRKDPISVASWHRGHLQ